MFIGPTNFVPSLAEECCKLGIELMQQNDDPDVRKAAFTLFGAVAFVAKGNMESILPGLVEQMLTSATSKEGISLEFKDEDNSLLPLEELSDDEDHNGDEISLSTDDSIHDKIVSWFITRNHSHLYLDFITFIFLEINQCGKFLQRGKRNCDRDTKGFLRRYWSQSVLAICSQMFGRYLASLGIPSWRYTTSNFSLSCILPT